MVAGVDRSLPGKGKKKLGKKRETWLLIKVF